MKNIRIVSLIAVIIFIIWYSFTCWFRAYEYESSDRGFAEFEVANGGRSFDFVELKFSLYQDSNKNINTTLCRTSKRNFLFITDWFSHRRWSLPYIEPSKEPHYYYPRNRGDAL
jgi:hypothetical protein